MQFSNTPLGGGLPRPTVRQAFASLYPERCCAKPF